MVLNFFFYSFANLSVGLVPDTHTVPQNSFGNNLNTHHIYVNQTQPNYIENAVRLGYKSI